MMFYISYKDEYYFITISSDLMVKDLIKKIKERQITDKQKITLNSDDGNTLKDNDYLYNYTYKMLKIS